MALGVTDRDGTMVAATDASFRGRDFSRTGWFERARATKNIQIDDVAVHDPDNGTEAIAFTAPILDAAGTFQGVVTSRVAMSTLEDVTTRTVRSLESRQEFAGGVAIKMKTSEGMVFVDSDLLHKAPLDRPQSDLLASKTPPFGDAGVVEEEYRGRPVVTGFARTKGFGDFPGLGWHVLVRMDRDRAIVGTALDALVTIDATGIVTDWNGQASTIFGWSREEALGQRLSELIIPPKDRDSHEGGLRQYLATGEARFLNRRVEVQALRRSGEEFPVELAISPVRVGGTIFFSAFIRDITERREADTKLKES